MVGLLSLSLVFLQRNIAGARDPEVLSLFATAIEKLGDSMQQYVPRIMEAVFECTLLMITRNFEVIFFLSLSDTALNINRRY